MSATATGVTTSVATTAGVRTLPLGGVRRGVIGVGALWVLHLSAIVGGDTLGPCHALLEICDALLSLESNNASMVMGSTDAMKLRSCMTLFSEADPECEEFIKVLEKYYAGRKDRATLMILKRLGR